MAPLEQMARRAASGERIADDHVWELARLAEKDDIKEFYLGMKVAGARGARRWKRKKLWR